MGGNSYWKYFIPGMKEYNLTTSILIENLWLHCCCRTKWSCLYKLENISLHPFQRQCGPESAEDQKVRFEMKRHVQLYLSVATLLW